MRFLLRKTVVVVDICFVIRMTISGESNSFLRSKQTFLLWFKKFINFCFGLWSSDEVDVKQAIKTQTTFLK